MMEVNIYNEKRFNDFREIINYSADKFGRKPAFIIKDSNGHYLNITYIELKNRFYTMSQRLIELKLQGKRIAVIGKNSFEWVLSYLCAAVIGVAVPIDKELHPEDVRDFMQSAECSAVFGENDYLENLKPLLADGIQCFDFSDVMSISEPVKPIQTDEVDAIGISKDEMQVLIFTSGTTGSAKGVCLSQYNICSDIHSTVSAVKITPADTTLSILPLHHTYECTLDCLLLLSRGACITYCDGLKKIPKNFTEYHPTVLVVVPALLKALNKQIRKSVAAGSPEKYKPLFETQTLSQALSNVPSVIRQIIRLKVRKSLGGKMRLFIVGAADLDTSLVDDFAALGIRTLQGYGLTECAPLLAGNSDFFLNPTSTGRAMPGITLKIDDPNEDGIGEILAKGDNIMLGYYRDEEATRAVFRDGWFCTGDLGCMDDDGSLYIKGRRKNVIVTSNGKNIYPEELEIRLSQLPEISDVIVLADTQNGDICVKAKIFPNLDFIKETLGRLPKAEEIHAAIQKVIRDVNEKIPSYKHIKVVEILTAALEKTTTQKIKRFGANLASVITNKTASAENASAK
ncbi:MAG TPA: AMP-binding protein [Oscillospiraceae bacterium]|nr:AMP-binding protein [Oscillospiraceae bacterium]HPK36363.1 AMP-binding protein [Oscillospiraceae bacterium]HPR76863.1 AMP-binding protein [Oscillospiraceae bacterium]